MRDAGRSARVEPSRLYSQNEPGFVYFIQAMQEDGEGTVKVGWSHDPLKRLSGLQETNPYPLILRRMVPGTRELERAAHRVLAPLRVHGEWFRWSPALERMMRRDSYLGAPNLDPDEDFHEVTANQSLALRRGTGGPARVHHRVRTLRI